MSTKAATNRVVKKSRPYTANDQRSANGEPIPSDQPGSRSDADLARQRSGLITLLNSLSENDRMKAASYVFVEGLGGGILRQQTTNLLPKDAIGSGTDFLVAIKASVKPRDMLEEMLCVQMAWVHVRLARLCVQASGETVVKSIKVLHDAADAASNTYRRLMQTLADYRNPRGGGFTAIRQQNNAGQQVIQNGNPENQSATNEQGLSPALPASAPALPPVTQGLGIPAAVRPAREALAVEHRPANAGGQGAGANERP